MEFAQNHGIPPKNNIIRMEQDIPKGKIRWAFVLHEYSQGFRGCLPPPRSMGFPRSSCPCQLGIVDGIDGEDHDDEQAFYCKKSPRQIMFCWYLMFIRCDPLAFEIFARFQETILFLNRYGIDIGWILWPVQFASMESMSNSTGVDYWWMFPMPYWLSHPLLL